MRCIPARLLLSAAAMLGAAAPALGAQQVDSARAPAGTSRTDSAVVRQVLRPPLSPRRAFLYSLAAPGYSQSVLGRPNAAAIFVLAEVVSITMIRESRANLADARRLEGDSVVISTVDPQSGAARVTFGAPRYPTSLVQARRAQVEDWIAALVANHLFSGIDAFVAAHLWDVPAQLSLRSTPGRTTVAARLRW